MASTYDRLRILGITGKAGAGKDTLAAALTLEYRLHRIGLADAVKGALDDLGGPTKDIYKRIPGTVREAWQQLGTECRLVTGNLAMWVDVSLAKMVFANQFLNTSAFVVPDIRFPTEVARFKQFVRDKGGEFYIVRVENPAPSGGEVDSTHSSETQIDLIRPDSVVQFSPNPAAMVEAIRGDLERFLEV